MISENVKTYATNNRLACTSLVAAYVMDKMGYVPQDVTQTDSWYLQNPSLWADISLWGEPKKLGSFENIDAIKYAIGGTIIEPNEYLEDGDYIVQRWCTNNGHSFLIFVRNGQKFIVDSSTVKGLTITESPNWIMPGCEHSIIQLKKKAAGVGWFLSV